MQAPLDADGDVSAVVVAYRTPDILRECLASVEGYRPRRLREVVVVDNSERPDEPQLDAELPWVRYVRNERNAFFRRAVNQGVELATSPYVLLLNPDTYFTDADTVAKLAEVLDARPEIGLVGPKMRGDDGLLAPQGERLAGLAALAGQKTYVHALWPRNPIARRARREGVSREQSADVETLSAACLLFRRADFLAVGGLDDTEARMYWEEHELARKLRRRGLGAHYRADAFVFHRWRQGGTAEGDPAQLASLFEEAMRAYYRRFYGRAGAVAYDALTAVQRGFRRLRR